MAHCMWFFFRDFIICANSHSYHTQSPESLFSHIPGVRVVMPRSPTQAKGLLLSAILECNDPVIFMEPKILYRAAVEHVPTESYTLPLSKADILKPGSDLKRTGRAIVVHESMVNYGVGAEVAATIQEGAFLRLEAPIKRVAGLTTHTGLAFESFIMPDVASECPFSTLLGKRSSLTSNRNPRCHCANS